MRRSDREGVRGICSDSIGIRRAMVRYYVASSASHNTLLMKQQRETDSEDQI